MSRIWSIKTITCKYGRVKVAVSKVTNWQKCIDCLRTELPAQQFNTWIRPLHAELDSNELRIFAPNRFILDWVKGKFLGRIQEIIAELSDDVRSIHMEVMAIDRPPVIRSDGYQFKPPSPSQSSVNVTATGSNLSALKTCCQPSANIGRFPTPDAHGSIYGVGGITSNGFAQQPALVTPQGRPLDGALNGLLNTVSPRNMDIIIEGKLRHKGALKAESTFNNFIEGKSNQLARAAALQVAENPGYAYNPLFIYGGVGLGKTHLMHAIGNYLVAKKPDAKVVYLHSETFVATMVTALQLNAINEFKRFYRSVDALLIDDIQFFAGKERSQEEFFHTFNALLEGGQQIILTCDRYHKEIKGLEERLKSRFGWGLTVAVEPPELETRAAILINKAELSHVELPYDAALYIAQRLRSNVRELEGALKRVIAHANFKGEKISLDLIKDALRDLFALQDKLVTIDNIQRSVAEYYKIKMGDMLSKRRNRSIARPRQVAMSLSKELTNHSLPEIGDAFGGRDHTTVLHAVKQIKKLRHSSVDIEEDYDNLLRSLSC